MKSFIGFDCAQGDISLHFNDLKHNEMLKQVLHDIEFT